MRRRLAALLAVAVLLAGAGASAGPGAGGAQPDEFRWRIERIDHHTRRLMAGRSWHRGCPVPIPNLRLLHLRYRGFDRETHPGELVVHRRYARRMVRAFHKLFDARFPIRRMRLVDYYGAKDLRSMKADNTSAFNCRWRAGSPGVWSQHAYGRAIDINPVENPYVVGDYVSPPKGRRYLDRSKRRRGMIHRHDAVVRAFRSIGWEWGGGWRSTKDYQHFSSNGR